MVAFEDLPEGWLARLWWYLPAESLLSLSLVSSGVSRMVTSPDVWRLLFGPLTSNGLWGRDPTRYLALLNLPRFSSVSNFRIVSTEDVDVTLWRNLVDNLVARSDRFGIGLLISANCFSLPITSLGRLVEAASCLELQRCEALATDKKEFLMMAAGLPRSKVRHMKISGMEMPNDPVMTSYLKHLVLSTWELWATDSSFTQDQYGECDWMGQGKARQEEIPDSCCPMQLCGIDARDRVRWIANHPDEAHLLRKAPIIL